MEKGLIVKNTGSWYVVRTDEGQDIECKLKGNFRIKGIRSTNPIAVGDRVEVIINGEELGLIAKIAERKNYIIRRSSNLSKESHILAANIDLCFLIVTVSQPITSTTFIDRFLASAEAYRVPVNLIFNKVDIYTPDDREYMDALITMYEHIGYPSMQVSALENEGLAILQTKIKNKITLFSGHSGVGKSTLINALIPGVQMKTGDVSDHHGKGKHTTTFSEMLELPQGGFIIDTPGIKGFGAIDMAKEEIYHYFIDLFKFAADCRFNNCIHLNEPNCAVRQAVEEHYISESRYKSYLSMMDEQDEEKYRK